MEIPAIYSVLKNGEIKAAPVSVNGTEMTFDSEPAATEYSAEGSDERMPLVVVDVKGLARDNLDDRLLSAMEFRGSDVWFLTSIYTVDDVFDCFIGNIAKVLVPYHTTRDDRVLKEIYDVSDNCIPVLFTTRGQAVCRGGSTKDIAPLIDMTAKIGYRETAVFDTDSSLSFDDWADIKDRSRDAIPFVRGPGSPAAEAGFGTIISDFRQ